ncbi:hypothetical protein FDP41_000203 [Naegleria fowleri]|uniref:Uncharacterized protein n=1 Tax=Naegleria fowleri TaxID=5763 RepID=A0A6A5CEZ5_NAEFO|nr:uncharacterized protein FDP41_000203 [Naegleria fowleri]KAF0985164.1 hypothetical protein FDP41_000203 [Naegleria fowleri]
MSNPTLGSTINPNTPTSQISKTSSKSFLPPPQLIPIDYYKTLDIVNNFTIQMVQTMNSFAFSCESKLSKVSSQIHHVEIILALLEKKLHSVDGMKERMEQWMSGMNHAVQGCSSNTCSANVTTQPTPPPSASNTTCNNIPPPPLTSNTGVPPPPPPTFSSSIPPPPPGSLLMSNTVPPPPSPSSATNGVPPPPNPSTVMTVPIPSEDSSGGNTDIPTCEQDPRLANYFRLLNKIGVPKPQIARKMEMDGLDPSLLDTPNAPSPLGVYVPPPKSESESDNDDSD